MKTIVCEAPNQFQLIEAKMPTAQAGEALVRIKRIGICGTDMHAFRGRQPYFVYPRILGHELSGEIVELGTQSAELHIGDQVAVIPYIECGQCYACSQGKTNCCEKLEVLGVHRDGGMQQFMTVPQTHLITTNGISLEAAATIECFGIGAHAVGRAGMKAGEFALVIGAGPIGLGVMRFLKLTGIRVIAMDMNDERLTFCQTWGAADYIVNATQQPLERIQEITAGSLAQVVFDATGNATSMESAFSYASFGGKVVYVSLVKADIAIHDPDFHKKEMTLMGSRNATKQDFQHVINAIAGGHLDIESFVTHSADFDSMIEDFEDWLKPESGVIKAMVKL